MDLRRKSFSFFKAKNVGKMAAIKLICSFSADKKQKNFFSINDKYSKGLSACEMKNDLFYKNPLILGPD